MPLADSGSPVTPCRKRFGKRRSRQMRTPISFGKLWLDDRPTFAAGINVVVFQVSITTAAMLAGQYTGTGCHTYGIAGDSNFETDTISGEFIYMRRVDHVVAIAADFKGP